MNKKIMICLLVALSIGGSAFAQDAKGAFEISPYVGLRYSDNYGTVNPDSAPLAGLRLGYFFTKAFHAEVAVQRAFAEADNVAPFNGENVNMDAIRLNLAYHVLNTKKIRPYVSIGTGWERIDSDNINSSNDIGINGGLGFRIFAGDTAGIRVEGRYVTADASGWQHNFETNLGLFFLLGAKKEPKEEVKQIQDADGDGVVDNLDQCPSTPTG
ncbi:MAG: porin family protein, partial [Deltaproteobacteria bacterium]|nr:porin family protein [Deltaproteobacteria bacterium]